MLIKQRFTALGLLILIIVLIAGTALLSNFRKQVNILKTASNTKQKNQYQTSRFANDQAVQKINSPSPLASNLPKGVVANAIGPVEGKQGKASIIAVSDGKTFNLVLEAKLADPPAGQFYEAWIGKSGSDNNLLRLGKLNKNNDSYTVSFSKDGDFSAYKVAVVTLEKNEGDKPETIILEGAF